MGVSQLSTICSVVWILNLRAASVINAWSQRYCGRIGRRVEEMYGGMGNEDSPAYRSSPVYPITQSTKVGPTTWSEKCRASRHFLPREG